MTGQLLSIAQVAEYVGLSPEAVRRATRTGELSASKLGGRIRVMPSDMHAWIDHNRIRPAAAAVAKTPASVTARPNEDELAVSRSSRRFRDRVKAA